MLLPFLILLGCDRETSQPHRQYIGALQEIQARPANAETACARIQDDPLRADCFLAAVEKLGEKGRPLCSRLGEKERAECHFILAEQSRSTEDCGMAGPYEKDCKLHLLSRALLKLDSYDPATAETLLEEHGLDDSEEGQTAVFRHFHSKRKTLDLSWCRTGRTTDICRNAGLQILRDRMNRARDAGALDCSGEPTLALPYRADPLLDAELSAFVRDNCSP